MMICRPVVAFSYCRQIPPDTHRRINIELVLTQRNANSMLSQSRVPSGTETCFTMIIMSF